VKQRWLAWGLVGGLHLALLTALWLHRPPGLGEHGERRLTSVRIVLPRPKQPPPPPEPRREPLQRPAEPRLIPPPGITVETQAPTEAAPAPATPAVAATPTEPARTTLRLTLPPGYAASTAAARNPALSDPRSNTARPTFEERIADAAAATGEWTMERTSDHRTLMRRGDTCVEVLQSRIDDMDKFNGNVAPRTVKMVGKPYKCK